MAFERSSGVILHPTSLPGPYGIGSLGKEAYEFIDFLSDTKQKLWQICPLGPTGYGDSPYQCFSAFAGNPFLVSLEKLKEEGLVKEDDLGEDNFPKDKVDYGWVIDFKVGVLKKAYNRFKKKSNKKDNEDFVAFCQDNIEWLEDYTFFMALKDEFDGRPWIEWDDDIKFRKEEAVDKYKKELKDEIQFHKFIQYLFFKQWNEVKGYANKQGISIIGDVPIFVAFDSADAWANPDIFLFDEKKKPTKVAGVPPDAFSETGQLWGNPLYDWDELKSRDYNWWIKRFEAILDMVDHVRLDHFRGFAAYWAVPADEDTAMNGEWVDGPGADFFQAIKDQLGELPIIAEDLGVITEDVDELREGFGLIGMKVLQFAFDSGEKNKYLPHNYTKDFVVYTGTHDNDTTVGWFESLGEEEKHFIREYLDVDGSNIAWDLIEAAWGSVAVFAIAPLQDILSLGSEGRMNTPGKPAGNWQWRFTKDMLSDEVINKLREVTEKHRN
ncbi:4-alpha-glucanotransferase [Halonatronum saccharophilum]|uniref:4-alpha-glucanotransferase n=1 Tax=Halonatronum saccharophilum TaxID=150060 RepID=UPI0004811029|nr:4-alpha-glucanotransferase [Halonatronum saccharophilum]